METGSVTWWAVHAAGLVGFGVSQVTGVGAALVLVPVLAATIGTQSAVAVMAPLLLVNSGVKMWAFRGGIQPRAAAWTLVGALPAAVVSAWFTTAVPELLLRRIVGVVIMAFVLQSAFRRGVSIPMGHAALVALGAVTGAASGLTSAGGPTTAMALRTLGLTKEGMLGTGAVIGVALQLVKMPMYAHAGTLGTELVPLVASLSVCAGLAALVGRRAVENMDNRAFDRMLHGTLAVLGAWMVLG